MSTTFYRLSMMLVAAVWMITASTSHAQPQIVFKENFESANLDQWVGKGGGDHHGQIVPDPLDSTNTNNVLNFTALNFGGDIFTASMLDLTGLSGPFVLSFDYLGLADGDPDPNDLGGFIGIALSLTPASQGTDHFWLAGTQPPQAFNGDNFSAFQPIDDGTWHHYDIDFTTIVTTENLTSIYIMLEQWAGSGGLPGHVYFDNIQLQAGQ
jgi:hypothetical protein